MNKLATGFILLLWPFFTLAENKQFPCAVNETLPTPNISECLNWISKYHAIDKQRVDATIQVSQWLLDTNQAKQALLELESLIANDLSNIDDERKWTLYNLAGETARKLRNYSKALINYKKAIVIADSDHKELLSAKTFLSLSFVLRKLEVNEAASEKAIRAYDIYFKYHEMSGMADALIQLGHIYLSQNNIQQAEQALVQARDLYELQQQSIGRANALILLASTKLTAGEGETAKAYLLEASRALEASPPDIHYRASIKLVRAMLRAKLYDIALIELHKLDTSLVSDSALVHYLVLESQIYQAKNDISALQRIDSQLKALTPSTLHMQQHVQEEQYKIAFQLAQYESAVTHLSQLQQLSELQNKQQTQALSSALAQYIDNSNLPHSSVHDYGQLHFSITEIIITCLTMFLSGFGISVLWNQLLAPRFSPHHQDDEFSLSVTENHAPESKALTDATPIANATTVVSTVENLPVSHAISEQQRLSGLDETTSPIQTLADSSIHSEKNLDISPQENSLEQQPNENNELLEFRESLVALMNMSLEIWQQETELGKVELAEKSGIWKVTIDDGRLRTRALERYLKLERLPKHPRWREVLRTGYFVLGQLPEDHELHNALSKSIGEVQEKGKQLSKAKSPVNA